MMQESFNENGVFKMRARISVIFLLMLTASRAWAVDRAAEIVSGMTLEQKIGQMIMASIQIFDDDGEVKPVRELPSELASAIGRCGFGGFILFDANCVDAAQLIRLTSSLREASPVPPFIAVDQEGGRVTRIPFMTTMGGNMALAATDAPAQNSRACAEVIAAELAALGINVDMAPVADVNSDPANPIIGVRSFSDVPENVAEYASAYAEGLRSKGITAVYKHFPGHGDTDTDSHTGLPSVNKSLEELRRCELLPFAKGIEDGVEMIMTAHIQFPQIERETYRSKADGSEITLPATLSRRIITDLLRREMGYDGIVITDALSRMAAITDHFEPAEAARLAIDAGVDILLMPIEMTDARKVAEMDRLIADIARMARAGEIDAELIDKAASRVISQKQRMGLFRAQDEGLEDRIRYAEELVGCEAHRDIERSLMRGAVTILRADGGEFRPMSPGPDDEVRIFYPREDLKAIVESSVERMKASGLLPPKSRAIFFGGEEAPDISDLSGAGHVVLISFTVKMEDMSGEIADRMREIAGAAARAGARCQVLSAYLPCDVQLFPEAEAVIASYGSRKGPNIPEAMTAMFGGYVPTGHLPIDIMKLSKAEDGSPIFTDEVLYHRGEID